MAQQPHKIAREDDRLLIQSMGKALRVTAIYSTDDDANSHMQRHPNDAVIACFGPFVFLANKYDLGT